MQRGNDRKVVRHTATAVKQATTNTTDPDARPMKGREGILPSYNAQTGVDVDTHLIVTQHVTQEANDCHQVARH